MEADKEMNPEWEAKKLEQDAVMRRFQEAADSFEKAKYEWDYWRLVIQWSAWREAHKN